MTHGGDSVHVWGGVHYPGKTQFRILGENGTGALYCEILELCVVPDMYNHVANNSVLVDDTAAPHKANIVHKYLTGEDIKHVDQPLYSPNLNTIEHM